MVKGTYYFTKDFMWGTATAAHQVEGHNTNNTWFAWEQEEGRILNRDRSDLACDWWGGRWREDFDRAQASAQNAHRLSIEWSRIQPAPDRWDENALDRYREMLIGLQDRKMTPMVTLHHFSEPLWVAEMGGWENEGIIERFTKFVEKTVAALKPYCHLWVTINEPNVFAFNAYIDGVFPPGKQDVKTALDVLRHMILAHARLSCDSRTATRGAGWNRDQLPGLQTCQPIALGSLDGKTSPPPVQRSVYSGAEDGRVQGSGQKAKIRPGFRNTGFFGFELLHQRVCTV